MAEKWRVGRKVPINVYEGDRPVCQCHNPEDAAQICAAMNFAAGIKQGRPVQIGKFSPPLDCTGVKPGSQIGKASVRRKS